ncbi:MAG TPA: SnoaL-like domain-containing protein [Puia sp.]|jgi:hypothetical protein
MTRLEIENSLKDLNQLVLEGKLIDAFEKYYHDEVSMQENELPPTESKYENYKREQTFLENIVEFRSAEIKGIGVGDNISFVIWSYDYTHKEWGVKNYDQVSIQEWKDSRIIKEKFVYAS